MFNKEEIIEKIEIEKKEVNNNNDKSFIFLTTKTRGNKRSSLFNFVTELETESNTRKKTNALTNYKTILKNKSGNSNNIQDVENKKSFYIIELNNKPTPFLFQKDVFFADKPHLRIDEYYRTNSEDQNYSKLSIAHWTQQWRNAKEEITGHVYFNANGQIVNMEVYKKSTDKNDMLNTQKTILIIDKELKSKIIIDCTEGQTLLRKLMFEKSERYMAASAEVDELEKHSENLFSKFIHEKQVSREEYKKHIEALNIAIDKSNRYIDSNFYPKAKMPTPVLKKIEDNGKNEISEISEEPLKLEPTAPKNIQTPEVATSKKTKKMPVKVNRDILEDSEKKRLLDKFNLLIEKFDKLELRNVENHVDRYTSLQALNDTVTQLVLFDGFEKSKRKAALQLVEKIVKKTPHPLLLLETYFKVGQVDNFIKFYNEIAKDKVSYAFCKKLLELLINMEPGATTENHVSICHFLNKNSAVYRAVITILGYNTIIITSIKGTAIRLLLKPAISNDLKVFCMFLEQGLNINEAGIFQNSHFTPLIKSLIFLSMDPAFIKAAIKHGASVDEDFKEATQIISVENIIPTLDYKKTEGKKKEVKPIIKKTDYSNSASENHTNIKSAAAYACRLKKYQYVPDLLNGNLDGLILALSLFVNANCMVRTLPSSVISTIVFQEDAKNPRFNALTNLLLEANPNQFLEGVSYIIYPKKALNSEEKLAIIALLKAIREKAKTCSPEDINHFTKSLEIRGDKEIHDATLTFAYYYAAIFMAVQKKNMTIDDRIKLMHLHYKSGIHCSKHNLIDLAVSFLGRTLQLASASCFNNTLRKEETYLNSVDVLGDKKKNFVIETPAVTDYKNVKKIEWLPMLSYTTGRETGITMLEQTVNNTIKKGRSNSF